MKSKDYLKSVILIALCIISISSRCEEQQIIACKRKNMTCLKYVCNCYCNRCKGLPFKIHRDTFVACSNVTEIPKEIPNEAETIVITGNNITTIRRGDFNNMLNLTNVTLNDNEISTIESGSFVNLTAGLYIDLNNNKLSRITVNMFRDISLESLYLNGNQVTEIEKDAFVKLPNLESIHLENNFLSRVTANMFSHTSIYAIALQGNPITVIERDAFVNMPRLNVMYLQENQITVIETHAFVNLPNLVAMFLNDNMISIIEPESFVKIGPYTGIQIHLQNNNLSRLTAYMFKNIALQDLYMDGNPITVIEKHAFVDLPILRLFVGLNPFLKRIETEAFVDISRRSVSLEMILSDNNATVIEKNAFKNVYFKYM